MEAWKARPLGFALVDESNSGALLVHHVSVRDEDGITMSGLWDFPDPDPQIVRDRLTHRIIIGTRDGIARTEKILGHSINSADLAGFVTACEEVDEALNNIWREYQNEEPKKRSNLKPLAARSWPPISEDGDAARILKRVGRVPYPSTTPTEVRDVLALANLVKYVVDTWYELETDRISRAYLNQGDTQRRLYPVDWVAKFPPYWPKAN